MRRLAGLAVLLLLTATAAPTLQAQSARELQESRQRLAEIKAERERLQRQQAQLQGQVHDVEDELDNIERQKQSTSRIVLEIERQIGGLTSQLDQASAELVLAQDNLAERKAVLERRLVDIYKRGPLHTWKVLLTAESFGDLLRRYKYLYLTSEQDRALVSDVERLRDRVARQRGEIVTVKDQLDATRVEREQELSQYSRLADAREKRLGTLQRSARANAQRLLQLERDASRLNNVLAALEKAARDEAAKSRASGTRSAPIGGALTTASLGRLDWPVEGRIVYQFGRDTLPQGGVIRWNGIGIAAAPGTAVHAVEAGRVRLVETMGTYGLTVILEHGNGYYSIYSHLQGAAVKAGDDVKKGQILGAVGGENSDYGPHLHFEIRGENQMALDPLDWLRRK
ncbi:MAG TPA: peptidoglycan DD-metalloendopeptidase family protein [Gemmatimonadales bacterium]|nr:peptidoglycan DD-metalloendopeptidase family protein [Gemmatimonadales bacterium]